MMASHSMMDLSTRNLLAPGEIKMKTVFITHASVDGRLALLMKQLISNTFQVGKQSLSCFCSSDIGDIEAGKHWFNQILEKLRKAEHLYCNHDASIALL